MSKCPVDPLISISSFTSGAISLLNCVNGTGKYACQPENWHLRYDVTKARITCNRIHATPVKQIIVHISMRRSEEEERVCRELLSSHNHVQDSQLKSQYVIKLDILSVAYLAWDVGLNWHPWNDLWSIFLASVFHFQRAESFFLNGEWIILKF